MEALAEEPGARPFSACCPPNSNPLGGRFMELPGLLPEYSEPGLHITSDGVEQPSSAPYWPISIEIALFA